MNVQASDNRHREHFATAGGTPVNRFSPPHVCDIFKIRLHNSWHGRGVNGSTLFFMMCPRHEDLALFKLAGHMIHSG